MKNIIKTLYVCLLLVTYTAHAQQTPAKRKPITFVQANDTIEIVHMEPFSLGTTQEEYNYINHGYRIQIESGLDMKRGYSMKYLQSANQGGYKCKLYGLVRDGDTNPCAFMLSYEQSEGNVYICLPHYLSPQELWNDTYARLERDFSPAVLSLFNELTAKSMSYFMRKN